jgi:hypothetical protein
MMLRTYIKLISGLAVNVPVGVICGLAIQTLPDQASLLLAIWPMEWPAVNRVLPQASRTARCAKKR